MGRHAQSGITGTVAQWHYCKQSLTCDLGPSEVSMVCINFYIRLELDVTTREIIHQRLI